MRFDEYATKVPGILKEYRRRYGYSQEEVAGLLHMNKDAYAKYEQGKNVLTLDRLFSLCEIYNVTPNILLGYEDLNRVNSICEYYGVRYQTIGNNEVRVSCPGRPDMTIPKPGFQEILFDIQEDIGSELEQEFKEYKTLKEMEQYWFQLKLMSSILDYNTRIEHKGLGVFEIVMRKLEEMAEIEKSIEGKENMTLEEIRERIKAEMKSRSTSGKKEKGR